MIGVPGRDEAAPYYYLYIDRVTDPDIVGRIEGQLEETLSLLRGIGEEKSLYRYQPGKWSIRELWNHITDTERAFVFRALWFARGFTAPLESFDQEISARGAQADRLPWASHIEEFRAVRLATICFFRNLPPEAWMRTGVASGNPFTVRSIAYIIAGHVVHHATLLKELYL
jgi:DinB superfamily